jgi:NAD(P)-dependent dehydrogenase (short-subunit alcohol dehydrogenase family)
MSLSLVNLFNVSGKSVLVTGGGRGIGKMIAEGFVVNGAKVYISSRDTKTLEAAATELSTKGDKSGGKCIAITASLSSRAGCEALAELMNEKEPSGLNVLVNNSGTSHGEPIDRVSGKMNWGWDKVLDLNVKAPFYLTRSLIPLLRRGSNGCGGPSSVIMIGSVTGVTPQNFPTHAYDTSKAALHALTRKLAFELAQMHDSSERHGGTTPDFSRITVNALAPGYFPTKMSAGLAAWGVDEKSTANSTPLGRMGCASDIAGAVLYLASPAGSWVTGAVIPVDGGILSTPLTLDTNPSE